MNPYDFVGIDWNKPPERRCPVWHHRLVGQESQHLYSGQLEINVYTETPFFIGSSRTATFSDPTKPAHSIQNSQGEYIIPGSSLKGMLRCVVETLGNGCLTLFDGDYRRSRVDYTKGVPMAFQHCTDNAKLCIACRIFGMLKEKSGGVFLGKVNIGDACVYPDKVCHYNPIYTKPLMEPKPHHTSFYLDEAKKHIAGRKYYFHHSPDIEPLTERHLIYFSGKPANRYIQPLDYDTEFHFRIDFTNLEADEFAVLLLAIALEEDMRHKLGYGKPLGLGSVYLLPMSMTLVDYSTRYTQLRSGRGKTVLEGDALWQYINPHIDTFLETQVAQRTMEDLQRIWCWPPPPDVDYYYPSKRDWFDTADSRGKRIADTKSVP